MAQLSNNPIHFPHIQSFAEFMRGNEFDIERFWIEHDEKRYGQRANRGPQPDKYSRTREEEVVRSSGSLPLSSDFTVSRDPLIMRLLKEQRKPRALLALLIEPRTRAEQILAALIFTLIAGAAFALLYALFICPAWLVTPFQ